MPGVNDNSVKGHLFVDSFRDEFFGKVEFRFKVFLVWGSNRQVGFKIHRKMLCRRHEATCNSDVGIFFSAETTAVLNGSAFSFFCARFGAGGIIDG